MLEVGCGTGFVLAALRAAFPNIELAGSELFAEGLEIARSRVPDVELFTMDITAPAATKQWDVVGAFDVLEHIDDDDAALAGMRELLSARGGIVLLVPQHPRLWSDADEFAHHRRRYTRAGLRRKVERAGLRVVASTSFVTTLLPAVIVSRLVRSRRNTPYDLASELVPARPLNRLFELLLDAERSAIQRGLSLPAGSSLLMIARR